MNLNFGNIINHIQHAIVVLDKQLHTVYLSPSAEALFAVSLRKAQQFSFASLPTHHGVLFGTYLKNTLDTKQPFTHHELCLTIPEQRRNITVDCTLSVIEEEGQDLLLMELSSLDRIMRIAREEQLLAQQQTTREIVRGMAHEIKNPLGGIRGAAQLLEREMRDDTQNPLTDIIISEVDRLKTLVNKMLGPNQRPNKASHNIHEILEHIVKLIEIETHGGVQFKREYDPSLPNVWVDRDQIIQALLNIVRNAWEASNGSANIILRTCALRRFTLGFKTHRLVIALQIEDDGPGIPPDLVEQIFFPMVTGRSEGTGLGLTIAQSLMSQHDGLIECESQTGRTVFSLYIPIGKKSSKQETT